MGNVEIPNWLKALPLAPEYHPTDTEFADPIAYISKIEKEASAFGICKIIPPLPKPSKKYVFSNLNKSLLKCPELVSDVDLSSFRSTLKSGCGDGGNDGEVRAVFTTRHQELGQSTKRTKGALSNPQLGVHKQVWQSGEVYTLEQFEAKSKAFARSLLGMIKEASPLVIETLFWKTASEKPIYVEYANDVPGSGFGEPEGQFRYFHRRRRKRASYRRRRESSDGKQNGMDSVKNVRSDNETKATPTKNDGSMSLEMPMPSTTSATLTLDEASQSTRRKIVNSTSDREGTAGWKLSNSPWNLQVIARSPGSLTRFMPDDIPGVTSPMIYIAMLFSWFAWHVEDHELHSMNFLHMGSPKTWYAVPGDYALAFEEVIRTQVYGGNVDRLAALTLLGEKTTLLSPEIVVASGIPCCRLIQNPGEFVVTFPRAYHIGFSHGFNCGEAANFGTPQWLKVAKEAAVRRAAMNYLPMLSHQQLLYLLTMSFVSRVPRSLLPGARSSRLRDRQKEERELLVKKAFIEDILNENKTLSILLGKKATYRIVSWDPDLLPCQSKESPMAGVTAAVSTAPVENVSQVHSGNNNSNRQNNLLEEMSLYMETLNDLYLDDDDLLNDFQVDSGTLACVACGILGFPFMAVIQPSERALIELLADHPFDQEKPIASEPCNSHFSPEVGCSSTGFLSGDPVPVHSVPIKQIPTPSLTEFNSGCNISSKYRRPRIFCLEHTVQIEEMMRSKGGAEVLVICHRDYQKIKAHARAIAEEIGSPFNYNEVPLESASQQDLGLIDLAIDDEEHEECGEDWTSKLGINLRYCVNVRKNSPSKQVQHALALGGLFSDKDPNSNFLNIRWHSRRSRTKVKLNHPSSCEPYRSTEIKMDDQSLQKLDGMTVRKEEKIIQYSRRKKLKPGSSTKSNGHQGYPEKHIEEVSAAVYGEFENHNKNTSEINLCNDGSSTASRLGFSPVGMFPMQHENLKLDANADIQLNSSPLQVAEALATASSAVGSRGQSENQTSDVLNMEGKSGNLATGIGSEVNNEIKFTEGTCMKNGSVCAEKCSRPHVIAAHERIEMPNKDHSMENIDITSDGCHLVSVEHSKVPGDGDRLMNNVPVQVNSATLQGTDLRLGSLEAEMEHIVHEESCMNHDVCDSATSDREAQRKTVVTCTSKGEDDKLCSHALIDQQPASIGESCSPREGGAAEFICDDATLKDKLQEEVSMSCGSEQTLMFSTIRLVNQPSSISLEESSEVPREPCAAPDRCKEVTMDNEVQQRGAQTTRKEELVLCSSMPMEVDQPSVTSDECSEVPRGSSAEEDLRPDVTLDTSREQDNQTTKVTEAGKLVSSSNLQMRETQLTSASAEVCCEVSRRTLANENLSGDVSRENEVNKCNPTSTPSNEEVPVCSPSTPVDHPSPVPVQNCSGLQRDTCSTENLRNKSKVPLLQHSGELENIESTMVHLQSPSGRKRKHKGQVEQKNENKFENDGFIRSPCEGLRPRVQKDATSKSGSDISKLAGEKLATRRVNKPLNVSGPQQGKKEIGKGSHKCDVEGCRMSFETKEELRIHKRNRCPYEGCGKKFRVHKYAMLHQRVHDDDRPFKCPWKGCSMTFKWAWARTEHIRVHTGERPYKCEVEGCGLSFRFVSDISRHRRKTGHYVN